MDATKHPMKDFSHGPRPDFFQRSWHLTNLFLISKCANSLKKKPNIIQQEWLFGMTSRSPTALRWRPQCMASKRWTMLPSGKVKWHSCYHMTLKALGWISWLHLDSLLSWSHIWRKSSKAQEDGSKRRSLTSLLASQPGRKWNNKNSLINQVKEYHPETRIRVCKMARPTTSSKKARRIPPEMFLKSKAHRNCL